MVLSKRDSFLQSFDWFLLIVVATIAALGVVNLFSATSASLAIIRGFSDLHLVQLFWLTIGFAVAALIVAIDYRVILQFAWIGYALGIAMLILVFLLGDEIRNTQRWIRVGSFSIQPSEFMKLFLIGAIAKRFSEDPKVDGRGLMDLLFPFAIFLVPFVLIYKQPDLGTALLCTLIFATMICVEIKPKTFGILSLFASAVVAIVVAFRDQLLIGYQKKRLDTFWAVLSGDANLNRDDAWHTNNAKVAIGNGGLWGKGFMQGTQNQNDLIPDQQSDFPFAVFAEEHGLVGSLFLVGLYLTLILWSIRIASRAKDRLGVILSIGAGAYFFWHSFFNLGMVTGLLPVVGITLPLFSYGGSSILTSMVLIGFLLNVSLRNRRAF